VLTKVNLLKRGWHVSSQCIFCLAPETIDHLFLHCPCVNAFWISLLSFHPQGSLLSLDSLWALWQSSLKLPFNDLCFLGSLIADVLWIVWKTRNDRIFKNYEGLSANSLYFAILYLFTF
jgi:zinc-binding in reverse transcriptase